MATALQTIDTSAPVDPMTLTTQPVTWALADSQFGKWDVAIADRVLTREHADVPVLIAACFAALVPVHTEWLADRLKLLWKSSTPSASLNATAWLHETGRLLSDLPEDIVGWAIDEAVKSSTRGFMPSVGEIRTHADAKLAERRAQLYRLKAIEEHREQRARRAQDRQREELREHVGPEATKDILARVWPNIATHAEGASQVGSLNLDPARECRKPTRADYLRLGVDPAVLDAIA